jgi:hypothetical protein
MLLLCSQVQFTLDNMQHCSVTFLDISQAFDKAWHTGLLYKLRRSLALNYFPIRKSYLYSRHFFVKVETQYTKFLPINSGVNQNSVLDPLLTLLYNADLLTSPESTTAIFTDDTAVVIMDTDLDIHSYKPQTGLLTIQNWFTRRETCPPVHTNMFNSPKKTPIISGCTFTDSSGTNTISQNGNN